MYCVSLKECVPHLVSSGMVNLMFEANFDETKVPGYALPDPLTCEDGSPVSAADEWPGRRAEILSLFETHVYGKTPGTEIPIRSVPMSEIETLGGKAKRKEIRLYFTESDQRPYLDLLIYLPTATDGPSPGFVGLNFQGNHSITSEPDVILSDEWMREKGAGVVEHRATEEQWPALLRASGLFYAMNPALRDRALAGADLQAYLATDPEDAKQIRKFLAGI